MFTCAFVHQITLNFFKMPMSTNLANSHSIEEKIDIDTKEGESKKFGGDGADQDDEGDIDEDDIDTRPCVYTSGECTFPAPTVYYDPACIRECDHEPIIVEEHPRMYTKFDVYHDISAFVTKFLLRNNKRIKDLDYATMIDIDCDDNYKTRIEFGTERLRDIDIERYMTEEELTYEFSTDVSVYQPFDKKDKLFCPNIAFWCGIPYKGYQFNFCPAVIAKELRAGCHNLEISGEDG